jgi:hypothetical protein
VLTVLIPHPAFLAVVEGKLVPDFGQREPPDLKTTGSDKITVQGYSGTLYLLRSERCSVLFKLSKSSEVELRSTEPCGDFSHMKELGNSLNLQRLDQKLQS